MVRRPLPTQSAVRKAASSGQGASARVERHEEGGEPHTPGAAGIEPVCQRLAVEAAGNRLHRQRSSQVGVRFSMKAQMPSSASRAIMFSVITSEA